LRSFLLDASDEIAARQRAAGKNRREEIRQQQ